MKIYNLDKNYMPLFMELDPFSMLSREELGAGFSLGAFVQNKKDGYDYPSALAVCTERDDMVIINWLYIASEHRIKRHGEEMLRRIFDYAKKKELRYVGAYFTDDVNRRAVCYDDRKYFVEHGFESIGELGGEWFFDIRLLLNCECLKKGNETLQPRAVSHLKEDELVKLSSELSEKPDYAELYSSVLSINRIDKDISFVLKDDNCTTGAIFLQMVEGVIYPVAFCAEDEAAENSLIFSAAVAIKKKYGSRQMLNVILFSSACRHIMDRLMPERRISNYLMVADTDVIRNERMYDIKLDYETAEAAGLRRDEINSGRLEELLKTGTDVIIKLERLSKAIGTGTEFFSDIHSFNELSFQQLQRFIIECNFLSRTGLFNRIPNEFDASLFDLDISSFIIKDDELKGVLLVGRIDDNMLLPVLMYCDKNDARNGIIEMIRYSLHKAAEVGKLGTDIILRSHDELSTDLIKKLTELCSK